MTDTPRKICFVTGSRADFGLLIWPMRAIGETAGLKLQLVATGMHLSPEFGYTIDNIRAEGFTVDDTVETLLSSDSGVGVAKSVGLGVIGFADAFARLAPDLVVVLGDRYETFAAAQAAMYMRLPMAHLFGGDVTEGAIDEGIRHAITKLSHLHFATHAEAARRIVRMGEPPERVHVVGNPGLDLLARAEPMSRDDLEAMLGRPLGAKNLLVTFHPVTTAPDKGEGEFRALLTALEPLSDVTIWITRANADAGGMAINAMLDAFAAGRANVSLHDALGAAYLPLLAACDAVVGNSSSGLTEAPSTRTPTVNVGLRQAGRLAGPSVLHVDANPAAISSAVTRAMAGDVPGFDNPYGDGQSAARIIEALRAAPSRDILLRKRFFDGEAAHD